MRSILLYEWHDDNNSKIVLSCNILLVDKLNIAHTEKAMQLLTNNRFENVSTLCGGNKT
jgi:hypothetical protein